MTFKESLIQSTKALLNPSDQAKDARSVLDETLAALTDIIDNDNVQVCYEVGRNVNYGLQYNVCVELKGERFKDIVFRAYIPVDGYPVMLDLFGDELVCCNTKSDFQIEISKFFQDKDFITRLNMYKSLG